VDGGFSCGLLRSLRHLSDGHRQRPDDQRDRLEAQRPRRRHRLTGYVSLAVILSAALVAPGTPIATRWSAG
jgi:hypothetical protein